MAEHLVFPLNAKLHLHKNLVEEQLLVPTDLQIRIRRKYYSGSCKAVPFSSWNARKLVSHLTNVKVSGLQKSFTRCCCLSALVDVDNSTISDWVPIADQVLLMASIFLTYIAGVIPVSKPLTDACDDNSNDTVPKNSNLLGSCSPKQNDEVNLHFAWDIVKVKLLDSLDAMKQGVTVVTGTEEESALRPSSLLALAEFPRLRLLWASFQWLKKQVNSLSGNHTGSNEELLMVFTSIIQNSCEPLCMAWLEEELCIRNRRPDKALLSSMINKLNRSETILQYIRKSGKEYLYSELVFTLGYGSARMSSYYDPSLFIQHGVALLEDLVITLADGIACMYLELISVDSSTSGEMNNLGLSLCSLSTRALQRLRNEVALHQWLHQNMESVVSMYEDRFDLCTFRRHVIEESSKSEAESFTWWKKLGIRRPRRLLPGLSFVVITPVSVSVKRTKELRALNGWQYYFSLSLELSDIAMPLVRTVIAKVSDAISFFLVCLIGRSLGLIYTGIRQSLRWK